MIYRNGSYRDMPAHDTGGPVGDTDARIIRYSHEPVAIRGALVAHSDMPRPKVDLGFTVERNRRYRAKRAAA